MQITQLLVILVAICTPFLVGGIAEAKDGGDPDIIFLEAEQFSEVGGWEIDQQSLEQVGSPYLLAHGLGVAVDDATTKITVANPGTYKVWVRTRDWVAPWKVDGAPGKFQVVINRIPLQATFGTVGEDWHWQPGGEVHLEGNVTIQLHDLTGFNGRCDALIFSRDRDFVPPNSLEQLTPFRRAELGLPDEPDDGGSYDLVVVGGGIAGCCTAISAARQGLEVALIQDRPVLGGNGSSEVRVWPEGHTQLKPYPRVGDIVEELVPRKNRSSGNAKHGDIYNDHRKSDLVLAEPTITLLTEQRVIAADASKGRVVAVVAQHIRSARHLRVKGRLFADCTGDGSVGFLAGADYEISLQKHQGMSNLWNLMDASDPKQVLKCECKDKTALAVATQNGETRREFPKCSWAIDLSDKPFPGRGKLAGQWGSDNPLENLGGWYWESGFDKDPINDVERIRDLNLRAMFGAWDALKNTDGLYPNHRIAWAAFIAGKRESRRLLGDVVLSADDFRKSRKFEDGCFPCSWHIDVHSPHKDFDKGHEGNEFISYATVGDDYKYEGPYWAPYRCLYSRNISNLFMAGRDISVTHEGLGPVRVMRTCGMMGEVVGKAAWICVRHDTTPRGVYKEHLPLLRELMQCEGSLRRENPNAELIEDMTLNMSAMIEPAPATAKFYDADYEIWGGSAVRDKDGRYHMYYSRWPRGLSHSAWVTHSEIAHAVSDSPFGPWKHRDVALPARGPEYWDGSCAHNPTVLYHRGKYYLYYMGNVGNEEVQTPLNWEHRNRQRIGVAVADSPEGPWTRFDKPIIDVSSDPNAADALCVSNPSVAVRPEGGILMVYKAVAKRNALPFGGPVSHLVATSDSPTGPFTKHEHEIFSAEGVDFAAEDPFIWRGPDRYWAIVKDNEGNFTGRGRSLALFDSQDGFAWEPSTFPLVSSLQVLWKSGQLQEYSALERPQLLLEDGVPVALFCAAAEGKDRVGTYNVQIPLRTQ